MLKIKKYFSFYILSFAASLFMVFTSGCASGGFKLTREYAGWVNSKTLILRIILYIFTGVVFAVTLLIDAVIFNTIDFWEGKVSAGSYEFKKENKIYHVQHTIEPKSNLKSSTILVKDQNGKILQETILKENLSGEITLYVDGKLRTKVTNIKTLPIAKIYDLSGNVIKSDFIFTSQKIAKY